MVPFKAKVEHKNFLNFFPDELMLKLMIIFKNSGRKPLFSRLDLP